MWLPERSEALLLLKEHIKADNLGKHCVASEFIMRALARHFGEDETLWGLAGLFHDIDLEEVQDDMSRHALVGSQLLEKLGFPAEGVNAVRRHNDELGEPMETRLDYALSAAETITGLVVATALVYPSKNVADVKVKSITKRMKEKRFAANVSRERILLCEKIGFPLPDFVTLALSAMKEGAEELGLAGH